MEKSKEFGHLEKELKNLGGKVFISFVHPGLYGPLRGLNFILDGVTAEELDRYLQNGWEDIGVEIWKETMLATRPMVLPWEYSFTAEKNPKTFKSIKEAEVHIGTVLKKNKSLNTKDPFYYRLGIH